MPLRNKSFPGFTKDEVENIRLQAIEFWNQASRAQEPLFHLVNDCERIARVQLPRDLQTQYDNNPDMAQLVPDDAYVNLRAIQAGLLKLLFSRKPYGRLSVKGKPNFRDERLQKAESLLQALLDQQHDGAGFESEAAKAIYQALVCGITCTYDSWVTDFEREAVRENGQIKTNKDGAPTFKSVRTDSYPQSTWIDIRRVRLDLNGLENQKNAKIVGFQRLAGLSELFVLNRSKGFYNFDEDDVADSSFQRDLYYEWVREEAQRFSELSRATTNKFGDRMVEEWQIRGLFQFKDKNGNLTFKDLVVSIGNRHHLLALKENDLPIRGWALFNFPIVSTEVSKMFPMGIIEPQMDALIEKFIKRNQSLDESARRTYDMFLGDSSAVGELDDYIEYERSRILKIDTAAAGMTDVRQAFTTLPRQPTGQDTFRQAAALTDDIQKGMFLNDFTGPGDPDRKETATAVTALVAGGTNQLELTATILKNSYFAPSWRKHLILYNFFKGHQENTVFDQQGQPVQIQPNDLNYFYKIDIDIRTQLDQPAMTRRFIETYPTMIGDPFWDQFEIRKTLTQVLQLPNADRLLPPNQHLADIIERENISLANGLGLFVSQFDRHEAHIKGHVEGRDLAAQNGLQTSEFDTHIEEHQQMQEEQQAALGNTKEFGGNSGQNLSSENASNKSVPAAGGQRRRVS